jgi:nucleotide-binding universal stress UspA family protein
VKPETLSGSDSRLPIIKAASYFMGAHVSPPDRADLAEKITKEVSDYLQAKVENLRPAGIEKISFVLAEGKGPEEIIDLSRRTSDNLVAISHARTIRNRSLGSR